LPLVEAISSDLNDQLLRVLSSQRLMYMDHAKFEVVISQAQEVFATWDENMKDFTNVAREGVFLLLLPCAKARRLTQ
jgi:dynein heavy chain 1